MNKAHNISAMIGYNQENEKTETLSAYRKEYAFNLPTIDAGSTANWSNGGGEQEWAIQSLFGRLNYNFKERYLFEANMRYDGHHVFLRKTVGVYSHHSQVHGV